MKHPSSKTSERSYSLWHPFTVMPGSGRPTVQAMHDTYPFAAEGQGVWVRNQAGQTFMNMTSAANAIGLGRPEIAACAAEQMRKLSFYPLFSGGHEPAAALAERLTHLAPPGYTSVFFSNDGSGAMETALKIARQYFVSRAEPARRKFIYLDGAYHGVSYGAMSVSLPMLHPLFDPVLPGCFAVPAPHPYRPPVPASEAKVIEHCINAMAEVIEREGADTIAAVVLEPVQSVGGIVPFPAEYLAAVRALTREHGILVIADEVTTGLGRLGDWFGCTTLPIEADLIAVSKGLTAGYFPLAATLVRSAIFEGFGEGNVFPHGSTSAGHPVGCAIALKVLDLVEQEGMLENAREIGAYLMVQLRAGLAGHSHLGDVRGRGMMIGVELVESPVTQERLKRPLLRTAIQNVRAAGILVMQEQGVFQIYPPLCLTRAEADQFLERFIGALAPLN